MSDLIGMMQAAAGNVETAVEPVGIDFDGTNDYLSRSSDLVGNSDGKEFTFSAWVYSVGGGFVYHINPEPVASRTLYLDITASEDLNFFAVDTSNNTALFFTLSDAISDNTLYHILISVDLTNASNRYVYLNDSDVTSSVTWNNYVNTDINFTQPGHGIGGDSLNADFEGRLAGVYLDYTYRDLSVEANRRDFIDADGLYVTPPTSGIISVPMDDPDDPGRNDGTGGDFTLNGVVAQSGRGPNQYNAAASTFDGTNDYLERTSNLSGISDGKQFTLSFFLKCPDDNVEVFNIIDGGGQSGLLVRRRTGGPEDERIQITAQNSSDTNILDIVSGKITANKWVHVAMSFDLSDSNKKHILIDGVSDIDIDTTFTNDNIDFTKNPVESMKIDPGELSDLWFDTTYIDLSSDNPFYDSETGKPKYLGASGELPTSSSPLIYLPLRGDDAGNNLGTGGNFTVTSGPYTGARGPSEYWASSVELDGSNQALERVSALTGASDSKTITFCVAFNNDTLSGDDQIFFVEGSSSLLGLEIKTAGTDLEILARDSSGSTAFQAIKSSTFSTGTWHVLLLSVDLSDNAKRHLYLDGSDLSPTWAAYNNVAMDLDSSSQVGKNQATSDYFDGKIGFLWFNTEYVDFSQEANRLKFFDAFNNPVDLGDDGSTPTGSQPLVYLNEGFHLGTNLGSGGNFTPQNTPTDGGYVNG